MARARMLSVDVAGDPELNQLSLEAAYFYLSTIPHLDRDGLITGHPVLLWAKVAPLRVQLMDKAKLLIDEWVQQGLVMRYRGADGSVLFFKGFRYHNANMPYRKESPSKFPPPPGFIRSVEGLVPDDDDARFRLAERFDRRSAYRKALMDGLGVGRDEVATYSRRGQDEEQVEVEVEVEVQEQVEVEVQAEDQAQTAFDDDDVAACHPTPLVTEETHAHARTRLSEEVERGSILEAWCSMMISALWGPGVWDDSGHYLSRLTGDDLERLARWLWKCHWRTEWFDHPDKPVGVGLIRHVVKRGEDPGLPPGQLEDMEFDIAGFADPSSLFEPAPVRVQRTEAPHADDQFDY